MKGPLHGRVFHLLIKLLAKNLVEFAHILLLVDVVDVPAEGLKKLMCTYIFLLMTQLQIVENSLQAKRNRFFQLLPIFFDGYRRHAIDRVSKRANEEECLDHTVQVAGGAFVL